jgi:hypothetical protein
MLARFCFQQRFAIILRDAGDSLFLLWYLCSLDHNSISPWCDLASEPSVQISTHNWGLLCYHFLLFSFFSLAFAGQIEMGRRSNSASKLFRKTTRQQAYQTLHNDFHRAHAPTKYRPSPFFIATHRSYQSTSFLLPICTIPLESEGYCLYSYQANITTPDVGRFTE